MGTLRERLSAALTEAVEAEKGRSVAALRLVLAALKDRDIAARSDGNPEGVGEDEILGMLGSMIKQRKEAAALHEQDGRLELAQREAEESKVIRQFLPEQMAEEKMATAITDLIAELDAKNLKDVGRVMAALKDRFAGRMAFSRASAIVKEHLS